MRIGVLCAAPVPYAYGGSERAAAGLVEWFQTASEHTAELVKVASPESTFSEVVAGYEHFASLDLSAYDAIVSTKYPTWMPAHPRHVVHLHHPLRGLYDTYHYAGLPERSESSDPLVLRLLDLVRSPPRRETLAEVFDRARDLFRERGPKHAALAFPGPLAREVVHYLDRIGLAAEALRGHLGISATVTFQRGYFPAGTAPLSVIPPASIAGLREGPYDAFFTASRLDRPKRMGLLVEAMRHVPYDVPLVIAGTGPEEGRLRELAARDARIRFVGHVDDAQLAEHYAHALAVPFVPADEDLGLITLEAMQCAKAVVTCVDSGGPTELVVDGVNGFVTAPTPEALGEALTRLAASPRLDRDLGAAARRSVEAITWDHVGARVLDALQRPRRRARRAGYRKLVTVSTYRVHPPRHGGQLRSHHLHGGIRPGWDVEMVSLDPHGEDAQRVVYDDGLVETSIPPSSSHRARESRIAQSVGIAVTDVVAGALISRTPMYAQALRAALADADVVLLAEPYMYPAVLDAGWSGPVVYDAFNAEFVLKDAVLAAPSGAPLREAVRVVEGAAYRDADLVVVCASDDGRRLADEYGVEREVTLVANGVDVDAIRYVGPRERRRLSDTFRLAYARLVPGLASCTALGLFIGSWHPPNLDAVERILDLARALPTVGFVIAGSVGLAFAGRRPPDNVVMLSVVSDAVKASLLAAGDVALNPMGSGSGTNLKMIEYMAAGLPTVTTPAGVRGLDARDGEHVVVADVHDFADAVVRVLADPDGCEAMTTRARHLAEEHYAWPLLARRLAGALDSLVPCA